MAMAHQFEFQPTLESSEDPAAEELQGAINSERHALHGWLDFKVRNELFTQLYPPNSHDESGFNIARVKDVIHDELSLIKEENLQKALRLHSAIPIAETQKTSQKSVHDYSILDIENLQKRIDIHRGVNEYINELEASGDDAMYELAEKHIHRTQIDALKQVLRTLAEQQQELEENNLHNVAKIAELKNVIDTLKAEIESANEQVDGLSDQLVDRDMELLDSELVTHLTDKAKQLAQ